MADQLNVTSEPVDDIPVLLAQGKKIGIAELLDQQFMPHGNWQATSFGWTSLVWLGHILSEGDHRLNQVEGWVEKRPHTLEISTGQTIRSTEWSDDRLGIVLDELADAEKWKAFERELNRRTVRVYDLRPKRVRVDRTTASGYWTVTENGLFQYGHSKDHRPDLPQLKVMLSALGIRAFIQNNQDYYLCPLSEVKLPDSTLEAYLRPVWNGKQALIAIERVNAEGQLEKIAEGYEQTLLLEAEIDDKTISWTERRLIIHSFPYAHAAQARLHQRLEKARTELLAFNEHKQGKRHFEDAAGMQTAAEKILKHYQVVGLLKLTILEERTERQIRAYGDRPARTEIEHTLTLLVEMDDQMVQDAERGLGWRVYATNHPQDALPLDQAVLAYREEYLVEHGFGRLKGKPLWLSPMFLQSDQRATGLIHLLSNSFRWIVETVQTILDAVRPVRTAFTLELVPDIYPDTCDSYLDLIRAVDRPGFAVHLDLANITTSPRRLHRNSELVMEAVQKLGPYIKSCHAKDVVQRKGMVVHMDETRPGLGGLDYHTLIREINRLDPDIPLMMEHLPNNEEYRLAAEYLRACAADVEVAL